MSIDSLKNDEMQIEAHIDELEQLCQICAIKKLCKNHKKLCFKKRQVWNYAKKEYAKRQKEGSLNGNS